MTGFVDLYCGAGGLSLGLVQAGLTPLFAADIEPVAVRTYRRNLGDHAVVADAGALTPGDVLRAAGVGRGDLRLVAGGPPCQGFSVQRRGATADPRNDQVLRFVDLAVALAPAAVLLENVPGLLGARGRAHWAEVRARLGRAGYAGRAAVLEASAHGTPSRRRRAIALFWHPDRAGAIELPAPAPGPPRTVRDAIGDLPEPPADGSPHPTIPNHVRVRISAANEERIRHVPPGGGRLDIPVRLQLPCHRNAGAHRHLDVFGRMEWDRPGPTITAVFDNFSRGRFAHPEADRVITAREGARLQSFPDGFVFEGAKKPVARQIGNAVPPALARALGRVIRSALAGGDGSRDGAAIV